MKKLLLVAALMGTAFTTPARATGDSHHQAALELMEVTGAASMVEEMQGSMGQILDQQFAQVLSSLPPERQEKANLAVKPMKQEILEWSESLMSWEKMQPLFVTIYTDVFNEDELQAMTAWYRTPTGRMTVEKMPEVMQKSIEVTQGMVMEQMPALQERLRASFAKLEAHMAHSD